MTEQQEKAAAEPPLDCRVGHEIERYLRQLAPHQAEREGPRLLRKALDEIGMLRCDVARWRALSDANAIVAEVCQRRHERDERLGIVPNV